MISKILNPDIKIIVVSAYLDDHNIEKAKELGAYECTHKNSQMFQILDRIIESM